MKNDVNDKQNNWRNAKQDTRNRIQFRFWLDSTKNDQQQMIRDLIHFKSQRKFAATIRNALRLFFALLLGDTSVLVELFPAVVDGLVGQTAALQATIAQQEQRIAELEAAQASPANQEFEAIMRRVMREEMISVEAPQTGAKSGGLQPLVPPDFDEDDSDLLEVKAATRKPGDKSAAQNFINAMMSLQG